MRQTARNNPQQPATSFRFLSLWCVSLRLAAGRPTDAQLFPKFTGGSACA